VVSDFLFFFDVKIYIQEKNEYFQRLNFERKKYIF